MKVKEKQWRKKGKGMRYVMQDKGKREGKSRDRRKKSNEKKWKVVVEIIKAPQLLFPSLSYDY